MISANALLFPQMLMTLFKSSCTFGGNMIIHPCNMYSLIYNLFNLQPKINGDNDLSGYLIRGYIMASMLF